MSERSVVAKLRAEVGDYVTGMGKAAASTKKLGDETASTAKRSKASLSGMAADVRKNEQHYDRLGNAALIGGTAIAAGVGFGVKAFADFDSAMSGANAALAGSGANMDKLRKLAIDLGKDTQFSSAEAAQGITELAKAGVAAEDIMGGGLAGALSLAAAGELEVAEASEIAASAMTQFKLEGKDIPHIADLLAAGAGKAQGSVKDMGMALNQAGLVAAQTGLTIEETTGALAAFASAGLVGSDAGTSLKTMLQRLTPQSEEASKQFQALGVSAYDANGNFVGLTDFAGQLQEKLSKLTPEARNSALGVMFGSDAVRAASVIYEQGAGGVQAWIDKVNDAGFAAEQAAMKTDNLRGDWERFTGAIDAVAVSNGGGANDFLRSLTQNAEGAVEAFGRLPGPVQQGALGLIALAGGGMLAFGALSKVVTSGANLLESLSAIQAGGGRAAKGLDATTKAAKGLATAGAVIAATTLAIKALVDASNDDFNVDGVGKMTRDLTGAADQAKALDGAFSTVGQKIDGNTRLVVGFDDALKTAADPSKFEGFQSFISDVTGADTKPSVVREQFEALDATLTSLFQSGHTEEADRLYSTMRDRAAAAGVSVDALNKLIPGYTDAVAGADAEQNLAGSSGDKFAGTLQGIGESSQTAEEKLEGLVDEIKGFGSAAMGARAAESEFQAAIDEATASFEKNGKTLDLNTEKGRANDGALRGLATAALESSAATLELSGSAEQAGKKIETGRAAFIKAATQMGMTKAEANKLADSYGLIPSNVDTNIAAPGAVEAKRKADNFIASVKAIPRSKESKIAATVSGVGTVQYLKALVDSMNSKTVNIRYTVSGSLPNGSRSLAGGLTADADGGMHVNGAGGLVKAYADGGMWNGSLGAAQPRIAPAGGKGILWAEEGAGPWEAFISGHPGKRTRSRSIAEDTVARLGGQIQWLQAYADGGMRDRVAMSPARSVGYSPQSLSETIDQRIDQIIVYANTFDEIERQARAKQRQAALDGRNP